MDAALIVLDGWGLGAGDPHAPGSSDATDEVETAGETTGRNAVVAAETPAFDRLAETGAFGVLTASGRSVGLPNDQMGNSEVGHLTIGAGRVVNQEYTRISDAIEDGAIRENEAITDAFEFARQNDGLVHFLGLVSDGGVHSDQAHLHALIELAAERDVEAVTHAFTDGRDTSPRGGVEYLAALESVIAEAGTGHVVTVSGRYYAMDRDENWERTKRAYGAIVERESEYVASSAIEAVEASYARDETDEFVVPTCVSGMPAVSDGDAVVWFNFRADRARQLTRLLADVRPGDWSAEMTIDPPDVAVTTMTQYDETFDLPVAFPPIRPANTLGEVLSNAGRSQLRIAESEKYAHVTYFLNGGREVEFDGEIREIVDSPDVPTYDRKPEMSAPEVTDSAIDHLAETDADVLVLNYANPDMVGHTGDFEAAVAAVEAVDEQLGRLADYLTARDVHVLVTADHGNADDMGTPNDPHTAHTTNDVPFIYVGSDRTTETRVRTGGELADVAPTLLARIGVSRPAEMTGDDLLEFE
ncbi:2,3-bisphosphoglycerate-independent phosphoglycerate mutase [Halovivax gelatinilyticus]|uniref:2,3-bisphosphoglycerate-independent phosphoglycerate mutase n=1 Tax=Halovivax gelatinilyticus TaxID=2961597 RepID=UPI0020CA4B72|nr:2,3-bisphosphoglycerate-independent phosphoglycerate mutase [Halovivax gelatinilyticus]